MRSLGRLHVLLEHAVSEPSTKPFAGPLETYDLESHWIAAEILLQPRRQGTELLLYGALGLEHRLLIACPTM